VDTFSYNVKSFKRMWRDLIELFGLLDHAVMTTSSHIYSHHHLEQRYDIRKIDFLIDMFIKAGQDWVLAVMTRPGTAHLITVHSVVDYLSSHMPEEGSGGAI